jgi:biotin operon repressor
VNVPEPIGPFGEILSPAERRRFVESQAELAEAVGATREAVAKALSELRRLGAVETGRRRS